jgi:hypothetical protein
MKTILTLLLTTLCAATSYGQTIKSLGFNSTNGQVIAATNVVWTNAFNFSTNTVAAQVRTNLGLGLPALTNTNAANFRTAIELGATNSPTFSQLNISNSSTDTFTSVGQLFAPSNTTEGSFTLLRIGIEESINKAAQIGYRAGGTNFGRDGFLQFDLYEADNLFQLTHDELTPELWTGNPPQKLITFGATITTPRPIGFEGTNAATARATTRTNLGLGLPALTNTSNVTAMRALSGSTNTNHPFSGSVSVVGTNNTNTLVFSNGILQEVQ